MIIIHTFEPERNLFLDAYSFDEREFIPLEKVLRKSVEKYDSYYVNQDKQGRTGKRFEVFCGLIGRLENYLGLKFQSEDILLNGSGSPYSCKEICLAGDSKECETFYANDKDSAIVICSMAIARKNRWFSGYTQEGECDKKKWWNI
jgi:hypothetical protein